MRRREGKGRRVGRPLRRTKPNRGQKSVWPSRLGPTRANIMDAKNKDKRDANNALNAVTCSSLTITSALRKSGSLGPGNLRFNSNHHYCALSVRTHKRSTSYYAYVCAPKTWNRYRGVTDRVHLSPPCTHCTLIDTTSERKDPTRHTLQMWMLPVRISQVLGCEYVASSSGPVCTITARTCLTWHHDSHHALLFQYNRGICRGTSFRSDRDKSMDGQLLWRVTFPAGTYNMWRRSRP